MRQRERKAAIDTNWDQSTKDYKDNDVYANKYIYKSCAFFLLAVLKNQICAFLYKTNGLIRF